MASKTGLAALAGLLALTVSACGDDKPGAKGKPAVPVTRDVLVTISDTVPLELLANNDDVTCYVRPDSAEITLRDADGKLVGSKTISGTGGANRTDGCSWEVQFPGVADSGFYEATVKFGEVEKSGTAEAPKDGTIQITVGL